MTNETVQQVAVRRARDFAGGVTYLSHHVGVTAHDLDDFIHGKAPVPQWLFFRVIDFLNDIESRKTPPPGFPDNWRDAPIPKV